MSDLRKAAEMALEALDCLPWQASPIAIEATKALRTALAQPVKSYCGGKPNYCTDPEDWVNQEKQKCTCSAKDMHFGRCCKADLKQEPVARVDYDQNGNIAWLYGPVEPDGTLLYTAPSSTEAAVLAEREACAKVCEVEASVIVTYASEQYQEGRSMGATVCAAAIRARGEK